MSVFDLRVRDRVPTDGPAVGTLLGRAFAGEPAVAALEPDLDLRPDSRAFVAEVDGAVVGCVRVTRGWLDAPPRLVEVAILGPLGVDPSWQRHGIGSRLLTHAIDAVRATGVPFVALEGSPGYYGARGWEPAAAYGISPPSDRTPASALQLVRFEGFQAWMRGRLVYPDTFWLHDTVGLRGNDAAAGR